MLNHKNDQVMTLFRIVMSFYSNLQPNAILRNWGLDYFGFGLIKRIKTYRFFKMDHRCGRGKVTELLTHTGKVTKIKIRDGHPLYDVWPDDQI